MHLEFLVEEPSAEAALANLVPGMVPGVDFDIHVHGGKMDLLDKLPGRLLGYSYWLPADWRVVVLIDEDRANCEQLKAQLEKAALEAGLVTRSTAQPGQAFHVINRLAVEELEAWFLAGDPPVAMGCAAGAWRCVTGS